MTGEKHWFVVEWDDALENIIRVWDWTSWLNLPVQSRPESSAMVIARDELDAFTRAMRGEGFI